MSFPGLCGWQMDAALDAFDSEDETVDAVSGPGDATARAPVESSSVSLSESLAGRRAAVQGSEALTSPLAGGPQGKKRRGRPAKAAAGGQGKRGKRDGLDDGSASPGVADELELDTDFVTGARSGDDEAGIGSMVGASTTWEACASGRIRLLARMQARDSLQATNVVAAEAQKADDGLELIMCNETTQDDSSSLAALDLLLQTFETVHEKLKLYVQQTA